MLVKLPEQASVKALQPLEHQAFFCRLICDGQWNRKKE